jgi:TonB family protein
MYFELEDFRPDTPRSPSVISTREGILLSIIFHLALVVVYLVLPKNFFEAAVARFIPPEQEQIRYVHMAPLRDRPAKPKLEAEQSDQDRRSASREIAPKPENTQPLLRGNTPDKVEGATANRPERAAGPDNPQPAPPSPSTPAVQDLAAKILPDPQPQQPGAASGSLGDKLRNLQGFLQKQNFDNDRGGQTEQQADIQFDSKGIDFGPWLRRFRAQVMSNWLIPETAMYLKGHVVLQFYVHRDGSITDLKVVQPSEVPSFTTSSFNAMKMTQQSRTAPLPPEYPTDKVLFTVTFYYNER